jgi:hypothetical protein
MSSEKCHPSTACSMFIFKTVMKLHFCQSFIIQGEHLTYDTLDPIATKIRWPSQQRPPKSWWDTWRNFLLSFSDANRFLLQPLGEWIEQEDCIHPWTWYLTEDPNTILERAGEQWFQHQKQGRGFSVCPRSCNLNFKCMFTLG